MKSSESPDTFAKIASIAWEYDIESIYIVDSTEGMLPEELTKYIYKIKENIPNVRIGFHGDNNLGLAASNSITFIKEGIDVFLMGIVRSVENTYFE